MLTALILSTLIFSIFYLFVRIKVISIIDGNTRYSKLIQHKGYMNFSDILPLRLVLVPNNLVKKDHYLWFWLCFISWIFSTASLLGAIMLTLSQAS